MPVCRETEKRGRGSAPAVSRAVGCGERSRGSTEDVIRLSATVAAATTPKTADAAARAPAVGMAGTKTTYQQTCPSGAG